MSLTLNDRQRTELNGAIIDYMMSQGEKFTKSVEYFKQESGIELSENELGKGLLEKKWTTVVRLQKKVMDLEAKLESMQSNKSIGNDSEVVNSGFTRDAKLLPKGPAKANLSGHRGPITAVVCHPLYSLAASASEDSTIKVWDIESGQYEFTFKGHVGVVTGLAFDSKGILLASCAADMTAKLWDMNSKSCIKTLKGHDHTISGIQFLPSGDHLVTCSRDESIKYWEVSTGYCTRTFMGHSDWVKCLSVSMDGLYLASGGNNGSIIIWQLSNGHLVQNLPGHDHVVEALSYGKKPFDVSTAMSNIALDASSTTTVFQSSSSTTPGASSSEPIKDTSGDYSYLASASRDKTVKLWDPLKGTLLATFAAHENWVRGVVIHSTGKYIISCSDDKSIRVMDVKESRCLRTISDAHSHFVSCLAISPKYPTLVSGSVDKTICTWSCT